MSELSGDAFVAIDRVMADVAERAHVPGIAYGLVFDRRLIHSDGIGSLHAGTDDRPDADSVFRIASMTKSFTGAAILLLRDEGVLVLDDPVAVYAPELAAWRGPTEDSPELTLRHLMTMSGGLPYDDAWADRHLADDPAEMDALFAAGGTFAHTPGTVFEYSNLGWAILGRVVERAAGARVQEIVRERVLGPLGMTSTAWTTDDLPYGARIATGWRWLDEGFVSEPEPLGDGGVAPMGGLWSTVGDLVRWVTFYCDAWPARDGADPGPVRLASRREQQQFARAASIESTRPRPDGPERVVGFGYAMGLFVGLDPRLGTHVGHSGGLPGFGSHMRWLPERGIGMVALGNSRYAPMSEAVGESFDVLADLDALPQPRRTAPSRGLVEAVDQLVGLLDRWDDTEADRLFADSVFLDDDRERRRAEAERHRTAHGPLGPRGELVASSALAGVCALASGALTLEVQLNAQVPPLVQSYEITETTDA